MWQPSINVLDLRFIPDNILNFIRANQKDALKWANAGASLPEFKSFYTSPRLVKVFPSITVLQTESGEKVEDLIEGAYSAVFEIAIKHGKEDYLSAVSKKYDLAIRSMLSNIPETTFSETSIIPISSQISELETSFDVSREGKNYYLQIFQTKATWVLEASSYGE